MSRACCVATLTCQFRTRRLLTGRSQDALRRLQQPDGVALGKAMRRASDAEGVWCPPRTARHVLLALAVRPGVTGSRVAGGGVPDAPGVDVVSQDQIGHVDE